MAKFDSKYTYKNAEVDLENGLIYEYAKDDSEYEVHSLNDLLNKVLGTHDGRIDFTLSSTSTPKSIEE